MTKFSIYSQISTTADSCCQRFCASRDLAPLAIQGKRAFPVTFLISWFFRIISCSIGIRGTWLGSWNMAIRFLLQVIHPIPGYISPPVVKFLHQYPLVFPGNRDPHSNKRYCHTSPPRGSPCRFFRPDAPGCHVPEGNKTSQPLLYDAYHLQKGRKNGISKFCN